MVASRTACDRQRLELLLHDRLTEQQHADTVRHLDTCTRCREQLETLAADRSWWREASEFLDLEYDKRIEAGTSDLAADAAALMPTAADPYLLADFSLDFLERADDPAALGRLGPYEVRRLIGRGGMGIVLQAFDPHLNRPVAIKVLAPQFATRTAGRKRFEREARAAAAVVHPHVVAIHAIEAGTRLPYLVMQYVAGGSLQQRLDESGPLAVVDILRIASQAAKGLAAAHAQGLVHRDIKPANILLEAGVDRVLLTDFGLARAVDDASLTRSGVIAGTPEFMAPEQAAGESVDHRGDLFSLGSVMYAMCTGDPPFRADSTVAVLRRVCDATQRPVRELNPEIPAWLECLINRLLAKRPEDRYPSAAEVAELLEQCLAHVQHPTVIELPAALRRATRQAAWSRRAQRGWLIPGLTAAALAGLLLPTILRSGLPATLLRTPATNSGVATAGATVQPRSQTPAESGSFLPPREIRRHVSFDATALVDEALEDVEYSLEQLEAQVLPLSQE